MLDIASREALAVHTVLRTLRDLVKDSRVDVRIDNQAIMHAWNNQGGKSRDLNNALKELFFTTAEHPADAPSRRLSSLDYMLAPKIWNEVQQEFGGVEGHSCDLMALDSNVMTDKLCQPLPHFTPYPSPDSMGVNLFAQDLLKFSSVMQCPYIFQPDVLVGPVLRFLLSYRQSCTIMALDIYPRRYWRPLLQRYSRTARKMASAGDSHALLLPSKEGWSNESGIPGDLWAFLVVFQ